MAALIRETHGVEATVELGDRKEFSVWVDGRRVARRRWFRDPDDQRILRAVGRAIRRR